MATTRDDDIRQQARELAASLSSLRSSERMVELRRRCAGDEALVQATLARLRALSLAGTPDTDTPPLGDDPSPAPVERADPQLPRRLGRFRVIRELGRGGMGIVYEAEQVLPRRRVALKILPRGHSSAAVAQFHVEVDATARVLHPGIPQVYEVFESDDGPVLVMEYVEGRALLEAAAELHREQKVRLLQDIANTVDAAHNCGVLHRDLKPSNVLVTRGGQAKVLDFGIAALGVESRSARPGSCTLAYAAPEQLRREQEDRRSDVYGVGALGLELLTGCLVVDPRGCSVEELARRKSVPVELPPKLPSALAAILARALAPDPSTRYANARALAEDFARYLAWEPVHAFEGEAAQGQASAGARVEIEAVAVGVRLRRRDRNDERPLGSLCVRAAGERSEMTAQTRWQGVELPSDWAAHVQFIDDLQLSEDARGTGTLASLFDAALELGLDAGLHLSFTACAPARYPDLVRLGFRAIGRTQRDASLGYVVPMVLVHHDLEHLIRAGSILAPRVRAQARLDDVRGLDWVRELLAASAITSPSEMPPIGSEALDAPLFAGLSPRGRNELAAQARRRPGSPGDTLIDAGERGRWMAIVDAGLVEIVVDDEVIAVRGPGELIGEMGFLLNKPRTAKVVVATPSTSVLVIDPDAIAELSLAEDRERLWRNFAVVLARKLERQTQRSLTRER